MRVPVDWLKEFVEFDLAPRELSEELTNRGLEIESLDYPEGKAVLDIELTPNRGDCASIKGVAREVSALTGNPLKKLKTDYESEKNKSEDKFFIEVKSPRNCPAYYLQYIDNITVGNTPSRIKNRLEACGINSQNSIVDITNYVMLETGQPIHAFDADKIRDNKIIVRRAVTGDDIKTLDGKSHKLSSKDLVIADTRDPVAIAGIMGGDGSSVTGSTRNVLLESAYFNPSKISESSRSLGINTEASYRFSRRVDPKGVKRALDRCIYLILKECGGIAALDNKLKFDNLEKKRQKIKMDTGKINNLLGTELSIRQIKEYLESISFGVSVIDENISVTVPTYRQDVSRPVDLIEEVARVHGYENMDSSLPETGIDIDFYPRQDPPKKGESILKSCGYQESVTHTIINSGRLKEIKPDINEKLVKIANPVNKKMDALRPCIIYSLFNTVEYNLNQKNRKLKFYERGPVFLKHRATCIQKEYIGFTGVNEGYYRVKSIVIEILNKLKQSYTIDYQKRKNNIFKPDRQAALIIDGSIAGYWGEVSNDFLELFNLKNEEFGGGYIDLDQIDTLKAIEQRFKTWSKYPSIIRDLSLVADIKLTHKIISDRIKKAGGSILNQLSLYDVYKGGNIEKGKKNLTYKLEFNSPERTLESEEVEGKVNKILDDLKKYLGIYLRAG